jgi:hypothetical protein
MLKRLYVYRIIKNYLTVIFEKTQNSPTYFKAARYK